MGHYNQKLYLESINPDFEGAVCEIGSKDYGNTQDFRSLFPGREYIGIDIEPGDGVDLVHDITAAPLDKKFGLVICCSVLEHVKNPWKAAGNIMAMMDGLLYVSVPWIQRYHAYPEDYWRFTFPGLCALFEGIELGGQHLSTFTNGEFIDLAKFPSGDNDFAVMYSGRKYLPCYELHTMGKVCD